MYTVYLLTNKINGKKMRDNHADVRLEKNGFYGKKHSEESKKLMSESLKGIPSWNKGKHLSKDHKKKCSDARKLWWANKKIEKNFKETK
jgi:hypothetical protein